MNFDVQAYWRSVADQDRIRLETFFLSDAVIHWRNTNERFSVGEFIRVNCDYPGRWRGEVERTDETIVTVVRVFAPDDSVSFHVVSFIRLFGGKIAELDEYWGEDGEPPEWRSGMESGASSGACPAND